jgi:hypothetical protein
MEELQNKCKSAIGMAVLCISVPYKIKITEKYEILIHQPALFQQQQTLYH